MILESVSQFSGWFSLVVFTDCCKIVINIIQGDLVDDNTADRDCFQKTNNNISSSSASPAYLQG